MIHDGYLAVLQLHMPNRTAIETPIATIQPENRLATDSSSRRLKDQCLLN